ncbi:MAG: winged helix-turn-helix transcriptional regulator [Promethearchaeota archaeon]
MGLTRHRLFVIILVIVIVAALWPIVFSLKPVKARLTSCGGIAVSISSGNFVPFVIATSFSRITDNDNNLILDDGDGNFSTRSKVYSLIEESPGIHFREICRRLKKEIGVIQYHLYILEKFNLITRMKDGRYSRFYVRSGHFDEIDRQLIAAWRRPVERAILEALLGSNGKKIYPRSLIGICGVTTQAITWHVNRLVKKRILAKNADRDLELVPHVKEKIFLLMQQGILRSIDG